ncbi:tetratricopeptide repeat protein [Dietzia aerolata]|uniref:Tetratricopeptide repeat protein n=1 Tax=Dietzia aerolata TaxID=595984 RepID=A0ABV5JQU8_9ACTN|nr:tetratricopeptide repeat protein [Dietzia aerolata]
MSRPGNRPPSAAEQKLAASLAGAVDLSGLKSRAEAQRGASSQGRAPGQAEGSAASVATRIQVDESTFEQEVLVRSTQVPVIIELVSQRAPTALTGILAALADEANGTWVHATVDVDVAPGIAQALQARAVPSVFAIAGGRPIADFEGEQPEEAVRQWLEAVLRATEGKLSGPGPSPEDADAEEKADPELDAAEEALSEGDLATAEQRFAALVEARPGEHSLVEALRYVQAGRRVADETDNADDGPVLAAKRSADLMLVSGEYDSAFSVLTDAIKVNFGDDRQALRTRLLELLETLPADDPRVLAARRDLASALY